MSAKTKAIEAAEIIPAELAKYWMTMSETQEALLRSRYTVGRLCTDGILEKKRYGRYLLISRDSIAKYLRQFIPVPSVTTQNRKQTARGGR